MSAEELLPGRLRAPSWGWFVTMLFQNGNRVVYQQVSKVGKCTLDAAATPGSIRLGHTSDQLGNFSRVRGRSGSPMSASRVFLAISFRCQTNRVSGVTMVAT
jgi:hypothetical protein